ncbi:hypothetical protein F4861DRAFT_99498 [Xylaria intraflava]|nr:hypothetical protein F4861DRAFT_99498 [Xylaria intraflava]
MSNATPLPGRIYLSILVLIFFFSYKNIKLYSLFFHCILSGFVTCLLTSPLSLSISELTFWSFVFLCLLSFVFCFCFFFFLLAVL